MKLLPRASRARWASLLVPLALVACASPRQPFGGLMPPAPPPRQSATPSTGTANAMPSPADQQRARLLQLQAEALYSDRHPVRATALLVRRAQLLGGDSAARQRNSDAIWDGLTSLSLAQADLGALSSADSTTRGWVELALLAQRGASPQQYAAWQESYPDHPGTDRLPALMMRGATPLPPTAPINAPTTVFSMPSAGTGATALLLPLSGNLSNVASLVQRGFSAEATRLGAMAPQVFDDSAMTASGAPQAFEQALSSGAGAIVGPLQKQSVAAVAAQGAPQVPVLALNYLDSGVQAPAGLLQFGLAPEDEARQAADDAYAAGMRRAVVLVPNDDRGTRILNAFSQRLQQLGGAVAASAQFDPGSTDFSAQVKSLLGIDASIARDQAVANALGRRPEFEPRRRGDIDFIFISGRPTQDRLMASMFRYWRADKLPIYATADVDTGNGDSDLAGIRFCDDPWLIEPGPAWDAVRQQITQATQGQGPGFQRLYALGEDAARIVHRLRQSALMPGEEIAGNTGELSIDTDGVVHRRLACARIVDGGSPQPTDAVPLPAPDGAGTDAMPPPNAPATGYGPQ